MKKIFTLLAFLVVTVNAAAQNTITYLDVTFPSSGGLQTVANSNGEKGVFDNDRLNVSGYVFYNRSQNDPWSWIDNSNTILYRKLANSTLSGLWKKISPFKGCKEFFGETQYPFTAANYGGTSYSVATFYVTNCSGIDVFLERYQKVTSSNPVNTFSIKAFPSTRENPTSSSDFSTEPETEYEETLGKQELKQFFPTLYGLAKSKVYKIELQIPAYTNFYEISFRHNPLTYRTTVTDGVNWGTMYLDFPVTIPTDHPNLQVFAVSSADETKGCSVNRITGSIPKNTGVLLHEPNVDSHVPITFTETSEPDPVFSMLSGTAETDFTVSKALQGKSQTTKVLTLGREKNNPDLVGFFIYNGTTLSQYKAYLTYDYGTPTSGNNVKGFYISGFDEFTGVQTVEIENTESGNWYSLQGVRLNARPTQRGIYLNNGKKVLVK